MGFYKNQLKALVKRNFLLKKAVKSSSFAEFLLPLIMIIIAYIVNKSSETKIYPEVGPTDPFNINYAFNINYLTSEYKTLTPTIGFVLPENNNDTEIINKIIENEVFRNSKLQFINFNNQKELIEYTNDYRNLLIAGIIFESDDYFHYTIRVNGTIAPEPNIDNAITNYAEGRFNAEENGGTIGDSYMAAFSPIQAAIDEAIIRIKLNDDTFTMHHYIGKLGRASSHYKQESNGGNLGYFVSNIFLIPVVVIVTILVKEKEEGIKDGLLMAGVHPTVFWLSWLIVYIIFTITISGFVTLFFFITKTFANTHPLIMFLSLFFYGISCCSLGFIFSTLFNNNKTATSAVTVIIVLITCCNMITPYVSLLLRKIVSPIICPFAIGSLIFEIDDMENGFEDLTFTNLFSSNVGFFFVSLIINSILYFILAIILDNLFANEGSKYLSIFKKKDNYFQNENKSIYEKDIQEDFNANNGERCIVEVKHVHKVFKKIKKNDNENNNNFTEDENDNNRYINKKSEFLAVNDVSFKVYQNEIFAILGHNGAGKTTLISIMVGLLKASQGDVLFDGRSIREDIHNIRRDFGVCAQYNIIFDELTVEEHIKFFAQLKEITVNVDEVLIEIDLIHQKKMKVGDLSGGQKRKLCIGMAIIGNPKYVFLDEPTTGLDPLSRRKIWDLLLKKKDGRVIFLTTHYMDEADILADRKLILSKGKIRCLGTSLFLKNHFNMNYDLDVETTDKDQVQAIVEKYLPESIYYENTDKYNKSNIESYKINNNNTNSKSILNENFNTENENNSSQNKKDLNKSENKFNQIKCHTWKLPLNTTDKFTPLLNELECQMDNGEKSFIKKYALNMPTLEELFIRLEDNTIDRRSKNNNDPLLIQMNDINLPKLKSVEKPNRLHLLLYLIKSRLKIFVKDKSFFFISIFFPVIVNGIMFIVIQNVFNVSSDSTKSNIISFPSMYQNSYFNLEPQSQFSFTKEDIISSSTKMLTSNNFIKTDMITSIPLQNITLPKSVDDTYYLCSVSGREANNVYDLQIYYNDTMAHAIPVTINALSNAILASKNINETIVLTSHLLDINNNNYKAIAGLTISGFMIGYFIVANISRFGSLLVREREKQLLQQLQLNGVSRLNYWISCFVTDLLIFLTVCILIFLIGVIVQYETLLDFKILILLLVLLLIWCIPTMLYQYVVSFLFDKEDTAFTVIPIINTYPVIFGYLIFIIINMDYTILEGIMKNKGIIGTFPNIYNMVLTILCPPYGFIAMVNSIFTMKVYEKLIHYDINFKNILKFDNGISSNVIVLIILTFILFFLFIRFDMKKNQTKKSDIFDIPYITLNKHLKIIEEGDDDIRKEYEYVKANQYELPLSVIHLSKEYKSPVPTNKIKKREIMERDPDEINYGEIHRSRYTGKFVKTAVVDVNFGVRNHECFGLLGPNGAGKSTTLNTVTSTIPQTTGNICFNGIESHLARLGEISMGYCPQHDILWKELTLREHLELFLSIRGYTPKEAFDYTTQYINALDLNDHQNKRTNDLSGGTKRKLSLLIAICGYPKEILLDEPTAGMDPSTRRFVWNTIKKTKNMNDSAIIMTTHSMEEAENLCDRLAILVNGRLSCIGSPEHIKMKFGESYILELQSKNIKQFQNEIIEKGNLFGGKKYHLEKTSTDRVKYEVKMTRNLGHIFEVMEECKRKGLVNDYSFNQTSLEQIFIKFAKQQIINIE
ncbi:P-loop containing nucleoside triphosphate hydrolase protein [Anaeromyces robustus]|uniref:p-loop containing nucleoside triphosphate hydrolase protein n=1 Tax=Anaeromyces robustus TaxID=1754192 RepID=A0A1Y1WU61_9FUNG|nr:P-loop containing nucleoside triphosphate hydrolase protein [Anaeromyces robustus]|eukprot:ORX76945.1 P-loop containing nucleoside triphosphate hydrolase protein [Anaeromyces robustus]